MRRLFPCVLIIAVLTGRYAWLAEWKSGIDWAQPRLVQPGTAGAPPSDAIVLFNGTDLSAWEGGDQWEIADGIATAAKTGITSRQQFGDCQIHLEFATPEKVEGSGQGRGNSGIYIMGKYEVQILDSFNNDTYFDGQCASIYKQSPPLVNASRQPGEWQTYEIVFTAPRFLADGSLKSPGYVTVLHNGVLAQNHHEIQGATNWDSPPTYTPHATRGPFHLQFHGNPTRFRNIWVRDLEQ